jgi:hypothetical protein
LAKVTWAQPVEVDKSALFCPKERDEAIRLSAMMDIDSFECIALFLSENVYFFIKSSYFDKKIRTKDKHILFMKICGGIIPLN